jgi:hypothetical protein
MAVAEHNVTRRLLLGAAEALPAAPLSQALRPCPEAWSAALAALSDAEAGLARAAALHAPAEGDETLEADLEAALRRREEALVRLLLTPACTVYALAFKVMLAIDHDVLALRHGRECLAMLRSDAVRAGAFI